MERDTKAIHNINDAGVATCREKPEASAHQQILQASSSEKSLLIIGYGQYGHLVEELAKECGYDKIGALDDNAADAMDKTQAVEKYKNDFTDFIVAIGNPTVRKKFTEALIGTMQLTTLIHPTAVISPSATIEQGSIIEPHVVVLTHAVVKQACIINAGAVINHDSILGEYSQVGCNAVVAARAQVPANTKIMHCQCFNN